MPIATAPRRRDRPGRRRRHRFAHPVPAAPPARRQDRRRQRRPGDALSPLLPVAAEDARGRPARARARRGARRLLRPRDDPSGVPDRHAGDAAADGADAGLPEHRAAVAGGAAQGDRRRPGPRRPRRAPARGHRPARAADLAPGARSTARACARAGGGRPRGPLASGLAAPQVRGAARPAALAAARPARAPAPARAGARRRARRAARALPRRAAVQAHARAAARRRRDRRRPRPRRADAPPPARRRRLRQDGRRRARRGARDRCRLAMRADGADRDPRRAAPEEAGRLAGAARRHRRLADRQQEGQEARRDARPGRVGRSRPRRRHARGDRGAGALREARPGDHRRAAPLRRRATAGAAREAP